ncbi:riboflavin synthase [Candidatus Pandoraea novymonadis]|uniref:Riboflavin synthase n=1 Tax=Candidatus Pandoraea novymonadis TaxID=1808959 RepID=A0ABX5FEN9_9BURK|nr:riboflavin synthase [Candidatus Pandoraea novymonadis]PSB92140.1 Riboflavin synthase [Candidatus Pandoraea novymonadis]
MFTGIITAVGRINSVTQIDSNPNFGVRLNVFAPALDLSDVVIGDSIAIQGACMTVIAKDKTSFNVDVSRESLSKTKKLNNNDEVNLEKALRPQDRLGGHIVAGHIDGLGRVTYFSTVGESHELHILAPKGISEYLTYKGSITVNGVSLTINRINDLVYGCEFSINIIPHTMKITTLKYLKVGDEVNLEIDLVARYVERMLFSTKHLETSSYIKNERKK